MKSSIIAPLRVVTPGAGDPRLKQTYDLAKAFLDAFNKSDGDRDILISAIGLTLAQMFVSAGFTSMDEQFVHAMFSQLRTITMGNMGLLLRKKP